MRKKSRERKERANLVKDEVKSKRRKTKGRASVIGTRRSNGCDYIKQSRFLNIAPIANETIFMADFLGREDEM